VKIALVCPYDWSAHGGVRDHVANLAAHLHADHEVRIFAPASEPVAEPWVEAIGKPHGVRFNRSVAPIALSPLSARHIIASLTDFAPHLTHIHEPLAPALSASATGFGGGPLVGTFHTWSDRRRVYRASAPIAR
jgi:phosphatidyl-myo-inositol alpha-mannosyltransferase